jgi:hypothetical protein
MVTTEYVLVLNVDRPMALDFLDELQRRLRQQVPHTRCSEFNFGFESSCRSGVYGTVRCNAASGAWVEWEKMRCLDAIAFCVTCASRASCRISDKGCI